MYADLAINETGDLLFKEKPATFQRQCVKFIISKSKVQKINFAISSDTIQERSNNNLKIQFEITDPTVYLATTYKGADYTAQLIRNSLETDLGELPERPEFGSTVYDYKHMVINDHNIKSFKKYLMTLISQYIAAPSIEIYPIENFTNGYMQTLHIDIYSGDSLISSQDLER